MFNPLCLLSQELLEAFVKANKLFFVRQYFPRARALPDENIKGTYLITHHSAEPAAKEHYAALVKDPNRYLYSWVKEEDKKKLLIASNQPQGYKVYAAVLMPDWKENAKAAIDKKLRNYLVGKLNLQPSRPDNVNWNLYLQYGELFIVIKLPGQEIHVNLADVEKFK